MPARAGFTIDEIRSGGYPTWLLKEAFPLWQLVKHGSKSPESSPRRAAASPSRAGAPRAAGSMAGGGSTGMLQPPEQPLSPGGTASPEEPREALDASVLIANLSSANRSPPLASSAPTTADVGAPNPPGGSEWNFWGWGQAQASDPDDPRSA